jgi:hypothetical protein
MNKICMATFGLVLLATVTSVSAQTKSYKEGQVTELSYIKIKPGKFDDYMAFLSTKYKELMEANKKAGLIVDYHIYGMRARTPQDPDLMLTVTYQNMAALDKVDEGDAVAAKVVGTPAVQSKQFAERESMREVLGSQLVQEFVLK